MDGEVDEITFENYLDGEWVRNDCPTARAYHYLSNLDLAPSNPIDDSPLGKLYFEDGPSPGNDSLLASVDSEVTVYGLHKRLLELGENVQLKFDVPIM